MYRGERRIVPIPFVPKKMPSPYRRLDHVSFRKPGANRIEGGILMVPVQQTWEDYFSVRSGEGAILFSLHKDLSRCSMGDLYKLGAAIGLDTRVYPWPSRVNGEYRHNKEELLELLNSRIHFEEISTAPKAETEAYRRAESARLAVREATRNAILGELRLQTQELTDIEEALGLVKPSLYQILHDRREVLRIEVDINQRRLAEL